MTRIELAVVVKSHGPEWKTVVIPKLYGQDRVGPIKSVVDAQVEERVFVMDLSSSRVHDWRIVMFESMVGRGGDGPAGAHTHPMGQVDGLVSALAGKASTADLTAGLASKAPTVHSHVIGDVTGLQDALNGKSGTGHSHGWTDITSKPTTFPPDAHSHTWDSVTGKPTSFTPSAHGHGWTEITGKPTTFPAEAHTHDWANGVTGKPTTFPPSTHSHSDATTTVAGFMSTTDKTKLDTVSTVDVGASNDSMVKRTATGSVRGKIGPHTEDLTPRSWVETNFVSSTSYNTGMAAKAGAPGDWVNVTMASNLSVETGGAIQVRFTEFGVQIRSGRIRMATSIAMDATIFTLPAGYVPPVGTFFSFSGMTSSATSHQAIQIHVEVRTTRLVTMRMPITNGPLFTLGHTLYIP